MPIYLYVAQAHTEVLYSVCVFDMTPGSLSVRRRCALNPRTTFFFPIFFFFSCSSSSSSLIRTYYYTKQTCVKEDGSIVYKHTYIPRLSLVCLDVYGERALNSTLAAADTLEFARFFSPFFFPLLPPQVKNVSCFV